MKQLVTIVALSVDSQVATLYKADGSTITIKQGDARLPLIVETAKEPLSRNQPVEVDITPILPRREEYEHAEKGTGGVIKFFRVAKSLLKKLVNTESPKRVKGKAATISPLEIGVFPGKQLAPAVSEDIAKEIEIAISAATPEPSTVAEPTNDEKIDAARERMHQIMGSGIGTEDPKFHAPLDERSDETIVAVHTGTGAVIPDAHKLGHQLKAASKLQNFTGFQKFIERLALIIDQRGHSVEDLMKFIERGDLPIADDGCIVIYKRLNHHGDHFTDVHSGKIKQKVGSYVFMKPGLVDPNRRQDCSNGLHVASLSYLRQFSGNATVVAKVRPEDVFAVPEYNTNKMRVCGYHILAVLDDEERRIVNNGGSLSSTVVGKKLLTDILTGNHIGITQYVEVGGHYGSNVTYTDVDSPSADALQSHMAVASATESLRETIDTSEKLDLEIPVAPPVDVSAVKPVVETTPAAPKEQAEAAPAKPETKVEKVKAETKAQTAQRLWSEYSTQPSPERLERLMTFKKASKKGWEALGIKANAGVLLEEEYRKQSNATVKVQKVSDFAGIPDSKKSKAQSLTSPVKGTGPKAKIAELLKGSKITVGIASDVLAIKKSAKKSWSALGVSDELAAMIESLTK